MRVRLKGTLDLEVEYSGKYYPAWMEQHSRRVWCLAGSVSFGAAIILRYDDSASDLRHAGNLRRRLEKAGYRSVKLKARYRARPRRSAPSSSSTAPGSPPAT